MKNVANAAAHLLHPALAVGPRDSEVDLGVALVFVVCFQLLVVGPISHPVPVWLRQHEKHRAALLGAQAEATHLRVVSDYSLVVSDESLVVSTSSLAMSDESLVIRAISICVMSDTSH